MSWEDGNDENEKDGEEEEHEEKINGNGEVIRVMKGDAA